jgi:hypothetical protein
VQFALRCYAPLASIAVIDEIPYAREPRQDDGNSELLLALLRALLPPPGHASREQLLSAVNQPARALRYEGIRWPLGPGLEGGARAATQMVLGFIGQRFAAQQGIRHLLLLSPQLCELLPLQFGAGGAEQHAKVAQAAPARESGAGQGRMGDCRLMLPGKTVAVSVEAGASAATASQSMSSGLTVTATHSLTAMQAYPSLKRETWMHLQGLRRRLADG